MNWTGKKTLVTGAGGFIGSHLCETLLELGADVTAMIHYNSRGDWGNLEFLPSEAKKALHVVSGNIEDAGFATRQIKGQQVVFPVQQMLPAHWNIFSAVAACLIVLCIFPVLPVPAARHQQ